MVLQELWDSIISCPFVKEGPVFPMPKEDKIRNTEASFLIIYRIQSALIMAAIEILLGHFTLLGTFLSKKDFSTAAQDYSRFSFGELVHMQLHQAHQGCRALQLVGYLLNIAAFNDRICTIHLKSRSKVRLSVISHHPPLKNQELRFLSWVLHIIVHASLLAPLN